MERKKTVRTVLAAAVLATACAGLSAQAAQDDSVAPKHRHTHASERVLPFPYEPSAPQGASAIEFRSFEQMTPQDRDLAADGESSIGERAGFAGLEFNEGKWAYRQVVCRALPNHLFLQFTRNNGAADESLFSASIPRGGDGRVRIIPIKRRGYSLFSPAPINALTISAFNHLRGEEQVEQARQWLGTGLCYAALAGAQPVAAPPANGEAPGSAPIGGPAKRLADLLPGLPIQNAGQLSGQYLAVKELSHGRGGR